MAKLTQGLVITDFILFVLAFQIILIMRLRFCHEPDQVNEDIVDTVILCRWRMNVLISCNSGHLSKS